MQPLKQSTAATVLVGPVLDSTGAAYTGMAIGDFNITKNGTTAAMAAAATATHSHEGHYLIALTTGNSDTLGRLDISCNKSTYAMPPGRFEVLTATAFDTLVTNGTLASTTSGRTIVVDAAGLADANMVKLGPSGSGVATTAALCTNLKLAYDTDFATLYDITNKSFLSKLGNFAMGGSSLNLTLNNVSVGGTATFTGAVTASNASNSINLGTDAINSTVLAASAVSEMQSGLATASALSTVQADTDDIQTRLPAALVSGRMDASVGAIATGVDFSSTQKTSIAASVWNAADGSYQAVGSKGLLLAYASYLQTAYDASGTFNCNVVYDNGVIHSTFTGKVDAIKTKTDQLGFTNSNKVDAAVLSAADFATAVAQKLAAVTLRRTMANIEADSNGDTLNKSSLYGIVQQLQNSNTTALAGSLTIKKTDGTTLGTIALATASGVDQVTGIGA